MEEYVPYRYQLIICDSVVARGRLRTDWNTGAVGFHLDVDFSPGFARQIGWRSPPRGTCFTPRILFFSLYQLYGIMGRTRVGGQLIVDHKRSAQTFCS